MNADTHPLFGRLFQGHCTVGDISINLSQIDAGGMVYSESFCERVSFEGAIKKVSGSGSTFLSCTFTLQDGECAVDTVNLQHTVFFNCRIKLKRSVDSSFFTYAQFIDCEIEGLQANKCDFASARFERCVFRDCKFRETIFENAVFTECIFERCTLLDLAFDYATFRGSTYEECLFSARQTLYAFGARELIESEGIRFSNGKDHRMNSDEFRSEIEWIVTNSQEELEAFPLINGKIVVEALDGIDEHLKKSFFELAVNGQYRRIELLARLMDYLPENIASPELRADLFSCVLNGALEQGGNQELVRLRCATLLPYLEAIRTTLQVRYGDRVSFSICIGSGKESDDVAENEKVRRSLIKAFDEAGIKYEMQESKNSPRIMWILAMFPPDQITTFIQAFIAGVGLAAAKLTFFSLDFIGNYLEGLHDLPTGIFTVLNTIGGNVVANRIANAIDKRNNPNAKGDVPIIHEHATTINNYFVNGNAPMSTADKPIGFTQINHSKIEEDQATEED